MIDDRYFGLRIYLYSLIYLVYIFVSLGILGIFNF